MIILFDGIAQQQDVCHPILNLLFLEKVGKRKKKFPNGKLGKSRMFLLEKKRLARNIAISVGKITSCKK